jgi:cyanophycin synthetase
MSEGGSTGDPVELRVLGGPNVYFTRPAVKLVLDVGELLVADAVALSALGRRVSATLARPGAPGSDARWKYVARLAASLTRAVAAGSGAARVQVVALPGPEPGQVVVAYPWRHRGRAEALGRAVAAGMARLPGEDLGRIVTDAARVAREAEAGPPPSTPSPRIPVVAVTGTNGKTTTTRLVAHIGRCAGRVVGWSSTDGVVIDGVTVAEGDWSGPGGAGQVLADPRVELAVLETARGGILLRGLGTTHNDVAVVTNVTADHLGLYGVHTLDQLADVKATVVRVTRPSGWVVLNADDPRVRRMRLLTRARPWLFSLDPDSPYLAEVVDAGGRGITVLDGHIAVLEKGLEPDPLVRVVDVPLTLAGLSRVHVANALAGTAAALAVGLTRERVVEGLRSFAPDPRLNPGRMNLYDLDGLVVIIDAAHNEDSLLALLDVATGLLAPDHALWTVLGGAGDRPNTALHAMGALAAQRSAHVAAVETERYRRGRPAGEMTAVFRGGAVEAGATDLPAFDSELDAVADLVPRAAPGDVVAMMSLAERPAVARWLTERGARPLAPDDVRALVRRD